MLALVVEREGLVIGDVVLWPADETLERGEMGWALRRLRRGQTSRAAYDKAIEQAGNTAEVAT